MHGSVTAESCLTHAHAHVGRSSYGNGESRACSTTAGMCVVPVRARARVTVAPGEVDAAALPAVLDIPNLRDHQARAIRASTIEGRDVLAVCPTGSGKTAGFIGSGLILGGVTLVVSPLRSLMADQYRRLEELDIPVRLWNSDVKDKYKSETLRLLAGDWRGFIYTTPESLKGRMLSNALRGRVTLAVIDEAHCCLRERGFRLSYAWLGQTLDRIDPAQRYACTATLPYHDRERLVTALRLDEPEAITSPVARSNLAIRIVGRYRDTLTGILRDHEGQAGIIFCATVRAAQKLHAELASQGWPVTLYHGRLSAKDKKAAQAAFMSGERPVGVVTDAFLLGIDKSDLRFAAHWDFPKSTEDWVQAFGRAGRDGLPATVYGCFGSGSAEGRQSREFLIRSTFPSVQSIRDVWAYLLPAPWRDQTASAIAKHVLGPNGKYCGAAIMTVLQRFGLAKADPHPDDGRKRLYRGIGDFDAVDWGRYLNEADEARSRFEELCELVQLKNDQIPRAIDKYFDGVVELDPALY